MDKRRIAGAILALAVMITGCSPIPAAIPAATSQTRAFGDATLPPPTVITPDMDFRSKGGTLPFDVYFKNGRLSRIGNGKLYGIDWSPDGSLLAIGSETGVYLIDAMKMEMNKYIDTGHAVEVVRFSPDGRLLATDDESRVAIWNVRTGELEARVGDKFDFYSTRWSSPTAARLGNISFSPDSSRIVIHSMNYSRGEAAPNIQIWDIEHQALVRKWENEDPSDKIFFLPDPVFSPDGRLIASPWKNGIAIFNVESGEIVKQLAGGGFSFFTQDGKKIVTENYNCIDVVDIQTGSTVRVIPGDSSGSSVGIATADGTILVSDFATLNHSSIDVWETSTGKHMLSLPLMETVFNFALHPSRNELATIDYGQNIRIWDLETGSVLRSFRFSDYLGWKIYPSPDGLMIILLKQKQFRVYDATTGGFLGDLEGSIGESFHAGFSPSGDEFAYISDGGEAIVWNYRTGELLQRITPDQVDSGEGPDQGPLVLRRIIIPNHNIDFNAWGWRDSKDEIEAWILNTCDGYLTTCPGTISPDGKLAAVTDPEKGLDIMDVADGTDLYLPKEKGGITNYMFTPGGRYFLSLRFLDWSIDVWNPQTAEKVANINHGMEGEGPILATQEFSFTSDGARLVTFLPYFQKSSVRLWDTSTWELVSTFDTRDGIGDAKISGSGNLVVALSGYVVYLWSTTGY